jgi:hypothetical protein
MSRALSIERQHANQSTIRRATIHLRVPEVVPEGEVGTIDSQHQVRRRAVLRVDEACVSRMETVERTEHNESVARASATNFGILEEQPACISDIRAREFRALVPKESLASAREPTDCASDDANVVESPLPFREMPNINIHQANVS